MKIIAITGSMGCGKSTLAGILHKLGYVVYDIDIWTRVLYKKNNFNKLILSYFPQVNDNGVVNKKLLRNVVFNDINQLRKLENIIHPLLENKLRKIIKTSYKYDDVIFIDAALIFELGWDKYCDLIIVADVNEQIQKQRVMLRDGISEEDFYNITNVQMNNNAKKCLADVVIDTNKSLEKLKMELIEIIRGL